MRSIGYIVYPGGDTAEMVEVNGIAYVIERRAHYDRYRRLSGTWEQAGY